MVKDKRRGVIHGRTSFGVNRHSVAAKVSVKGCARSEKTEQSKRWA